MITIVRRTAVAVALLALAACFTVATPAPAGASTSGEALFFASPSSDQVVVLAGGLRTSVTAFPTARVLAGHFTRDTGAQAFLYNPGSGPDGLLDVARSGSTLATTLSPMPVGGRYEPFVADLNRDGHDDIFWYAPGPAKDYVWFFTGHADQPVISKPMAADLVARPIPVLIDGSGDTFARQGILWYGVGDRPDSWWLFDGQVPTAKRVSIAGTYRTTVGHFYTRNYGTSRDQVLFYDPASGRSSVWTYHKGDGEHRSDALSRSPGRGYIPFATSAGMHSGPRFVFWYGPGSNPEQNWSIQSPTKIQGGGGCCQINGSYRTIRDAQGRSADEEIVFLGEGTSAKTLQLAAEHSPLLGTITPITGLPAQPRGALTWFEQPVA